ncbi:MAG: peptide deformylase [Planctomycetes bacterium]|nr:peptide deformylase [Planctomycetota bacterium]
MAARAIVLLGDPRLHATCTSVTADELPALQPHVRDLHDTMRAFQRRHGWGRAIAAPQIGLPRRVVAMHVDRPMTFYNPTLDAHDAETVTYWEDCMSFPDLLVRVRLPRACRLTYRDEQWRERRVELTGDYAALLQHEVDHLDGVLATMRAVDDRSLALRSTLPRKDLSWQGSFRELG